MRLFQYTQIQSTLRKTVETLVILSLLISSLEIPQAARAASNPLQIHPLTYPSGVHIEENLSPSHENMLQTVTTPPTYGARVIGSGYYGGPPSWGSVSVTNLSTILGASDSVGAMIEDTACPRDITPYIIVDLGQTLYLNGTSTDGWIEMRVYRHSNPNLTWLNLEVSSDNQIWTVAANKYDTGGGADWWTIGGVYTGYVRFARASFHKNSGCYFQGETLKYEFDSIRALGRQVTVPDQAMFSLGQPKHGSGDPRECQLNRCNGTQSPAGDPINTYSGGLDYSLVDLSLTTQAGPLSFERSYSSLAASLYSTPLGSGWTHNQDIRLTLESNGARFKAHTANQYHFTKVGDLYLPDAEVLAQLTHPDANSYLLTTADQSAYMFDQYGRITAWTDPLGKRLIYTYDQPNGHLTRVAEVSGQRYLDFHYEISGNPDLLSSVSDHTGRSISFSYTGNLLTGFTDANQKTWTYQYDSNNLLIKVKDPQQNVVMHTEYENGKAVAQYQGDATTPENKILTITSNADGTKTVTDALGNSQTLTYDARNTVISQTVTDQSSTILSTSDKTYDQNFRPATTQDGDNPATQLSWSPDGANLTAIQDAAGHQTQITYDNLNHPTQVTPAQGVSTTYSYSGNLLTSSKQTVNGVDYTTTYTYTTEADAPEPAKLLRSITDPLQHTTTYHYDALGQLVSTTDAENHTIAYAYDDLGRQVAVTDPGGIITRTYFDALDQVTAVVRNLVGQTIETPVPPAFDPNTPDQNVRTEFIYDASGNQIAVKQVQAANGDGLITRSYYDPQNRRVTSVQNFVSASLTDPAPAYDPAYPDRNVRTDYSYDANGNPIAQKIWTDASGNGRVTRTYYDGLNRVKSIVQNLTGQTIGNANPPAYNPTAPDQNVRTDDFYDAAGDRIATKHWTAADGSGIYTRTYYDALHQPVTVIQNFVSASLSDPAPAYDPASPDRNVRTDYSYDANGNPIASKLWKAADGSGLIQRTYFDALNHAVTTVQNLVGQSIETPNPPAFDPAYPDQNMRVDHYFDADGASIANKRWQDAAGNGQISRIYYDAVQRPMVSVQNFISAAITDPAPTYDPAHPDQNVQTQVVYTLGGQIQKTLDPNGRVTFTCYDGLERAVKQIQNPTVSDPCSAYTPSTAPDQDIITSTQYDAAGHRQSTTDANGKTTTYGYDALGRLLRLVDPLQHETQYTYDGFGNPVGVTDARGIATHYEYDGMNRLSAVIENYRPGHEPSGAINVRTEYRYDHQGSLTQIKDGRGNLTTFTYNAMGRLSSETDALNHATHYTFTAAGNRASLTDANGTTTAFSYDGLERLTGIDYPDPDPDVSFTYDALGNRQGMTDGTGTTTWTYDGLGRTTTIQDGNNQTMAYGYDAAGQRTRLTYPGDRSVTYQYDGAGRLQQVTGWDALVIQYHWDKGGRLATASLPNNLVSSYTYDDANHLTGLTQATPGGQTLAAYGYSYDADGNRIQAVEYLQTPTNHMSVVATGIDAIQLAWPDSGIPETGYRLERSTDAEQHWQAIAELGANTLGYTDVGLSRHTSYWYRLTAYNASASETQTLQTQAGMQANTVIDYTYDPLNRLTAASYSDGSYFQYSYDATGNRLSQTTQRGTQSYAYDAANRLTSVDGVSYTWDDNGNLLSDGNSAFTYDHANQLKTVIQGSDTYSFAYNGQGDRVSQTVNGTTTRYLLDLNAGLTQVLADGTNTYLYGINRIAQYAGTDAQYFLPDALGSVRQLADANGAVALSQSFDPFGNPLQFQGTGASNNGYTGELTDGAGLQFLRARYYSPQLGRFLTRDPYRGTPWRPASLNLYVYSQNNPIIYVDPSGYCPEWTDVLDWIQGMVYQYSNDMSMGLLDRFAYSYGVCMDCNVSDAYRQGQQAGRIVSTTVATVNQVTGAFVAAAGAAGIVPTAGGGAACALATGGICALPAGGALVMEGGMVVAGTAATAYGTDVIAYSKSNPIFASNSSPQLHKLTDGEIKMLQNAGYDIHELKGGKSASKYDLFKDSNGNVYQKPKNGKGPGEELGINLNQLRNIK